MSYQAVQWALDEAPMLRMPTSGLPDTTARAVLVARAERADEHGRNSHASIADVMWRTGFDTRTIQRAETRLEKAGLLVADGTTRWGTPRWNLDMTQLRDPAERDQLEAEIEAKRAAEAARHREIRRRRKEPRTDAESVRTDGNSVRTDPKSVRRDSASVRTDAEPPEPPRNLPGTSPGTTQEPPSGGAPPPDPRRPPDPSGRATDQQNPLSEPLTPAQDQEGDPLPHAPARETTAPLRLVAANDQPATDGPPRGIFPIPVPGRRLSRAEEAIAAATARREAARRAHQGRTTG